MKQINTASLLGIFALTAAILAGPAAAQAQLTRTVDPDVYDPNGLFRTIDGNDDNQLNIEEYSTYVNRYADLGDVTSINIRNNDGYEGVFRHYDRNGDGQLTREELSRASRIVVDSSLAT